MGTRYYYYGLRCITKSGLHGFLSKFVGMSSTAMGRDINSGVGNGCTVIKSLVALWGFSSDCNLHSLAFATEGQHDSGRTHHLIQVIAARCNQSVRVIQQYNNT
jgi:hypothetical protein